MRSHTTRQKWHNRNLRQDNYRKFTNSEHTRKEFQCAISLKTCIKWATMWASGSYLHPGSHQVIEWQLPASGEPSGERVAVTCIRWAIKSASGSYLVKCIRVTSDGSCHVVSTDKFLWHRQISRWVVDSNQIGIFDNPQRRPRFYMHTQPANSISLTWIDWWSCGFTSRSTQNRSFRRFFPRPFSWLGMEKKLNLTQQKAQLSPRDRTMHCVSWNLAYCHATVQKLLVR